MHTSPANKSAYFRWGSGAGQLRYGQSCDRLHGMRDQRAIHRASHLCRHRRGCDRNDDAHEPISIELA